jgi:hypothetical protein
MMRFSCVAYMAKFRHIHFSADKAKLIIEPIYEKVVEKRSLIKGRWAKTMLWKTTSG